MVEFKCIGHDSRHVCRSVLVASGGFLFCILPALANCVSKPLAIDGFNRVRFEAVRPYNRML